MSCVICENESESEYGFSSPNTQFVCKRCNQRWWCYNKYYNHWTTVDDDFTWKVIVSGIDDIPISIGKPATVMSGYEHFDVKPVHDICQERVPYPKLTTMAMFDGQIVPAVQCTADWEKGNIFKYQLLFPLESCLPEADWIEPHNLKTFHIPYVGPTSHWPYEVPSEELFEKIGKSAFAFLVFDQLKIGEKQASFIVPLVFLGDHNVGVIKAGYFYDEYFRDVAVEKFDSLEKA